MCAVHRVGSSSAGYAYSCLQIQFGLGLRCLKEADRGDHPKSLLLVTLKHNQPDFKVCGFFFLISCFFSRPQGFLSASLPLAWWPLPSKDTAPSATLWSPVHGRRAHTPTASSRPPGCCRCSSWCPTRSSASSGLSRRPTTQLGTCAAWTGPARKPSRRGECAVKGSTGHWTRPHLHLHPHSVWACECVYIQCEQMCRAWVRGPGMTCLHEQGWGELVWNIMERFSRFTHPVGPLSAPKTPLA